MCNGALVKCDSTSSSLKKYVFPFFRPDFAGSTHEHYVARHPHQTRHGPQLAGLHRRQRMDPGCLFRRSHFFRAAAPPKFSPLWCILLDSQTAVGDLGGLDRSHGPLLESSPRSTDLIVSGEVTQIRQRPPMGWHVSHRPGQSSSYQCRSTVTMQTFFWTKFDRVQTAFYWFDSVAHLGGGGQGAMAPPPRQIEREGRKANTPPFDNLFWKFFQKT